MKEIPKGEQLWTWALQAVTEETEEARLLALSNLVTATQRALAENEQLRRRPRLVVVS